MLYYVYRFISETCVSTLEEVFKLENHSLHFLSANIVPELVTLGVGGKNCNTYTLN